MSPFTAHTCSTIFVLNCHPTPLSFRHLEIRSSLFSEGKLFYLFLLWPNTRGVYIMNYKWTPQIFYLLLPILLLRDTETKANASCTLHLKIMVILSYFYFLLSKLTFLFLQIFSLIEKSFSVLRALVEENNLREKNVGSQKYTKHKNMLFKI